jgi:hypothetical protein
LPVVEAGAFRRADPFTGAENHRHAPESEGTVMETVPLEAFVGTGAHPVPAASGRAGSPPVSGAGDAR